ncbi:MAG: hypothetical protein IKP05_02410 [Alphaproteobacteria bacterium]|nr:hypothetical protein [Alphaproteobacteria bacterium]
MKKYIDRGLDFLRKHTYLNYLDISEKWLVKIGLSCLYFVFPVIAIIFIARYHRPITALCGSAILVAFGVVLASIFAGYIADKMLEYVKPNIEHSQTKIVNGALMDVLATIMVLVSVGIFFGAVISAIKTGSLETLFGGLLATLVCSFFVSMLLEPEKTLNIRVHDSATPAQSLIAICSFLVKASYRLVPIAFGSLVIVALICGIDLLFSNGSISLITTFARLGLGGAMLPLVGYFLFLIYYFVLDFLESFFRMSNDVRAIAESKDGHKAK